MKIFNFEEVKSEQVGLPINQFLLYSTIEDQEGSILVLDDTLKTQKSIYKEKEKKSQKIEKSQKPKKPVYDKSLEPYDRTGYEQRFFSKLEFSEKQQ